MALLNCKECNNQVSTQAKRCPHCGAKAPKKKMSMWIVIPTLVFWSVIIYACSQASENMTPAEKTERAMRHAAYQCGYSIKETLNDPRSADFDYDNANIKPEIKNNQAAWVIRLPVRAKNAFNATIYTVYQCRVRSNGDDNWETLSIKRIS